MSNPAKRLVVVGEREIPIIGRTSADLPKDLLANILGQIPEEITVVSVDIPKEIDKPSKVVYYGEEQ